MFSSIFGAFMPIFKMLGFVLVPAGVALVIWVLVFLGFMFYKSIEIKVTSSLMQNGNKT
jgi:hypothetical protein